MKIRWLEDAVYDLQELRYYIAQDNHIAARQVVEKIFYAIEHLSIQPAIGRQGRVVHTRELIIVGIANTI